MVSHSNNDVSNALLRHYSRTNSTVDTTRICRHVMFLKILIKKQTSILSINIRCESVCVFPVFISLLWYMEKSLGEGCKDHMKADFDKLLYVVS